MSIAKEDVVCILHYIDFYLTITKNEMVSFVEKCMQLDTIILNEINS